MAAVTICSDFKCLKARKAREVRRRVSLRDMSTFPAFGGSSFRHNFSSNPTHLHLPPPRTAELLAKVYWDQPGSSPVVQWLRIRLPEQGTRVPYLVWEDPTCLGATKPAHSNNSTLQPQPLKPERPRTPAPQAKVTLNEKPVQPNWRVALTLCKERKLSQARNRLGATRKNHCSWENKQKVYWDQICRFQQLCLSEVTTPDEWPNPSLSSFF